MGFRRFLFWTIFSSSFSCKPYDVNYRCMLNCFLFEKFYLHYALCDFDSILLHCTKLFIRLSIGSEQIFDITFETTPIEKSCVRHSQNQQLLYYSESTTVCEPGYWFRKFSGFDFFDFPFPGFSNKNSRFCQLVSLWNLG